MSNNNNTQSTNNNGVCMNTQAEQNMVLSLQSLIEQTVEGMGFMKTTEDVFQYVELDQFILDKMSDLSFDHYVTKDNVGTMFEDHLKDAGNLILDVAMSGTGFEDRVLNCSGFADAVEDCLADSRELNSSFDEYVRKDSVGEYVLTEDCLDEKLHDFDYKSLGFINTDDLDPDEVLTTSDIDVDDLVKVDELEREVESQLENSDYVSTDDLVEKMEEKLHEVDITENVREAISELRCITEYELNPDDVYTTDSFEIDDYVKTDDLGNEVDRILGNHTESLEEDLTMLKVTVDNLKDRSVDMSEFLSHKNCFEALREQLQGEEADLNFVAKVEGIVSNSPTLVRYLDDRVESRIYRMAEQIKTLNRFQAGLLEDVEMMRKELRELKNRPTLKSRYVSAKVWLSNVLTSVAGRLK